MAEYPTTDLNSQLIARGLNTNNPQQTYVDFAEKLASNQQTQDLQEQAIARAVELSKQSRMQTKQEEEAGAAGVNPLLQGSMTPQAAIAYVKVALKAKGVLDESTEAAVDEWGKTLTGRVNSDVVEAFLNHIVSKETNKFGSAVKLSPDDDIPVPAGKTAADLGLTTGDKTKDQEPSDGTLIAHVHQEGMYQEVVDNNGNIQKVIPGGKEPVDQTAKADAKAKGDANKRWSELDKQVNIFIRSQRGNQVTSAINRGERALNEITTAETLTKQVLNYIQSDISGIFTGGVPPEAGRDRESFITALQDLNAFIAKYTGLAHFLHSDLGDQREYLTGVLVRLYLSSINILKAMIKSEEAAYQDIITADPARWEKLVNDKVATASEGLSAESKKAVEAVTGFMPEADGKTPEPKDKKTTPAKKVAVPKYTVEK